jgi:hypothetical protein
MTTPPSARERTTPGADDPHHPGGRRPSARADARAGVPAVVPASSDAILSLAWYERMGHAAIFPCGDDDVERIDG